MPSQGFDDYRGLDVRGKIVAYLSGFPKGVNSEIGAHLGDDKARMAQAAGQGYSTATDLADWLVRALKVPFREAHHVTGRIVAAAEAAGVPLHELPLAAMRKIEPRITGAVFKVLTVERSVASRTSYGGTAAANVRREAAKWRTRLGRGR